MPDIFDKIKDKLDEGISALTTKSKGAIELARQRNQLRTLNKEKDDGLRDLGRSVYDMLRLDKYNPQEVTDFCRKIGEVDRQIVLAHEEIKKIQTIQSGQEPFLIACECGAGLTTNQNFCSACGRDISGLTAQLDHPPEEPLLCPSCGLEIKAAAKFCGKCGARQ